MTSGRILPIPLWLVIVLFIFGAGVGLGAGYSLSLNETQRIYKMLPWSSQNKDGNKTIMEQPVKPQAVLYPKTDKRWLANLANGPVKRALLKTAKTIQTQLNEILSPKNIGNIELPEIIPVHITFKTLGSVATLTELDCFCQQINCDLLEAKIKKKLLESRYDFPVEDGKYELLYNFTINKQKKAAKVNKGSGKK